MSDAEFDALSLKQKRKVLHDKIEALTNEQAIDLIQRLKREAPELYADFDAFRKAHKQN